MIHENFQKFKNFLFLIQKKLQIKYYLSPITYLEEEFHKKIRAIQLPNQKLSQENKPSIHFLLRTETKKYNSLIEI